MSGDGSTTVLIAHKDPLVAAGAAALLQDHPLFDVVVRKPCSIPSELALLRLRTVVLIVDYEMGMRHANPGARRCKVLILTHFDSETHVRSAIERGIRGYLHLGCTQDALCE